MSRSFYTEIYSSLFFKATVKVQLVNTFYPYVLVLVMTAKLSLSVMYCTRKFHLQQVTLDHIKCAKHRITKYVQP